MAEAKGRVIVGLAATDFQSDRTPSPPTPRHQRGHLLRSMESLSPSCGHQIDKSEKVMAINKGKMKGQCESHQDLEILNRLSIQSDSKHLTDIRRNPERSDIRMTRRTPLNDFRRSGYDFQYVRQKFEVMSKSEPIRPVDYTVVPGQRGRPTERTSNRSPYRSQGCSPYRSHSAAGVRSAPPSPVCSSRSVLNLSDPSSNHMSCTYSSPHRRFSHSSSVLSANNSSSSSSLISAPAQTSTVASQRFLLPDSTAGSVISKQYVPKSDHSKKCGDRSHSHLLKSPVSSSQYSDGHSAHLPESDIDLSISGNSSLSHNLDQWLQSVVSAKNTDTHVGRDRTHSKNRRSSSSNPSTKYKTEEDKSDDKDSRIVFKDASSYDSVHTQYGNTSGKYSESVHYVMSNVSSISSCQTTSYTPRDPPVTICITQDPEDVERDFLNLSAGTLHKDLSTHRSLSPRSSFGSVCSIKSSNADSAVDMNNPDEDSDHQCKVSPTQTQTPLTTHSLTSLSDSLSYLSTHPGIPVSGASPECSPASQDVPQVVVSDHSVYTTSDSVHLPKSADSQGAEDMDHISRPWSPEDSAYSGNSDLSLDDTEDEEPPPPPKKKQSSWKIIRHIVRWSPFVQVFKKNKYPWIQLAGHQGNFQAGESGAVLKKLDNREKQCYLKLMSDTLRPFVPEYRGDTEKNGDKYIQLQDLLCEFSTPCVMDVKMGCRTYLEEELEKARSKPTLRKDMYKKMIEVDPNAPSPEEREKEGVTKARYLQWRDEMSSSVTLGFRIEGIKKSDGSSSKDFKKTKTREHVHEKLKSFIGENTNAVGQYIERMKAIRSAVEDSEFFQRHEVISSSLLFVHDSEKANIWIIDFGKTEPLPSHIKIDHRQEWMEGNHEDGYLAGLDRLLSIFSDLLNES